MNGLPITAAHVRELLARLGALGVQAPGGGSLTVALTDADGALRATAGLDQLRRLTRHGCRQHPDRECGCPLLDRPAPTEAYEPTAAQHAFVTTRDRACRFPNCGQRVGWADRDHVIPHAHGGATDCANLCCLCRRHHRLKTHAPGWTYVMTPDGILTVRAPSGVTRTTRPPGLQLTGPRVITRPPDPEPDRYPPAPDPADDPPPF